MVLAEVPDEFFFLCLGIPLSYSIPKFNGFYHRLADIFSNNCNNLVKCIGTKYHNQEIAFSQWVIT